MKLPVELNAENVYEAVGGRPWFDALVERFFAGVEADPLVRKLYPEDLTASKAHTAGFLAQYWGGGFEHYSEERGHPRLRMRHHPYVIDDHARDAWLLHMRAALDRTMAEQHLDPSWEQELWRYLVGAAIAMVNHIPDSTPEHPVATDLPENPR